jgi:hypothetical protein
MIHAFNGAGAQHSLSPVDAVMGGDGTSMRPEFRASLVNIAHIQKINDLRGGHCRARRIISAPRWGAGVLDDGHWHLPNRETPSRPSWRRAPFKS